LSTKAHYTSTPGRAAFTGSHTKQ